MVRSTQWNRLVFDFFYFFLLSYLKEVFIWITTSLSIRLYSAPFSSSLRLKFEPSSNVTSRGCEIGWVLEGAGGVLLHVWAPSTRPVSPLLVSITEKGIELSTAATPNKHNLLLLCCLLTYFVSYHCRSTILTHFKSAVSCFYLRVKRYPFKLFATAPMVAFVQVAFK